MSPPSVPDALRLPPTEAIERFRRSIEAITGSKPTPEVRLGVAISGGTDSLALLLLAAAAYPEAIVAATVDHGLRDESAAEARWVGEVCERLGVAHDVLALTGVGVLGGNLQEQAREQRYLALAFWAGSNTLGFDRPWRAEFVAIAHQRDDLAETFLMRARRGSGVGGLAAMRARRPIFGAPIDVPLLIRPLLDWSRDELNGIVDAAGLSAIRDPSNEDGRFDRARIRALIAGSPDLPADRLARAASNLRSAEDALTWTAKRLWAERVSIIDHDDVILDPADLPHEFRRRLVLDIIGYLHFETGAKIDWDGRGVDALVARLDRGDDGTLAEILARAGETWHFRPAPPRRSL